MSDAGESVFIEASRPASRPHLGHTGNKMTSQVTLKLYGKKGEGFNTDDLTERL